MRDKNKPRILRGDIIYVNLGQKVNNSVQSGVRPCVVISNNVSNNKSDILNIYPFTTKLKKNPVHEVIKPGDVKGYFQADSETVKKRLDVYHEQTQPLIDYYSGKGALVEVDGTKDMNDVFADIVKILGA